MPLRALPDAQLAVDQRLGSEFLARGISSFLEAAVYVHRLPYGRTRQASTLELVLVEGRGTCSSKHALLAALAREHRLAVQLRLAFFEMNAANTPLVGPVLREHGLTCVPEAHCFLACAGERVDLTHPDSSGRCTLLLLEEEVISPEQVGAYKQAWHHDRLSSWSIERGLDSLVVWQVREQCIRALASASAA
jgi:hypothetical protein